MNKPLKTSLRIGLWVVGLVGLARVQLNQHTTLAASTPAGVSRPVYPMTDQFTTDLLNSRVLQSAAFRLVPGAAQAEVTQTIRRTFGPNRYADAVLHGNAAHVPVGWAYVELLNATQQPQPLVLSMPQYRCNSATLFVGRGGRFDTVGTLRNTTPVGNRFFPFISLAFPVTLQPHERLPLLLRTQSSVGFHEVALRLSRQSVYAGMALTDSIRDGLQVVIFLILALVALLIGWLSDSRLLTLYGVYLVSLCGACACFAGYLSFLPYPDWLSVNADTVGTLARFFINITVHPFFYEVIKPAIRHRRRYKRAVAGICLANALFMALHLIPFRYYGFVNYGTNLAMVSLTMVNIGWLFYFSVLAWRRAGIWSMLVVCLIGFAPVLLSQILSLVQAADGQDTYRQPALHPLLIIAALSYLTFEQFRNELVTKRRMQAQVRAVQERTDMLRRREIERIGRDLHDQVGNTLAAVLGYLGRATGDTEKPHALIVHAISELRFLSHNLVKDDDRPLTDKVETLVSRFNDFSAIAISFADYTEGRINRLPALKQQNLYSIVQELLTNIIRHSRATQAHVQFFADGNTVDISVEDDGIGFDVSKAKTVGIGLHNLHKRAELAHVEIRFDAAPGGTSVQLKTTLDDAHPNHSD